MQIKPFETFVIKNKKTGYCVTVPSGKNSWKKAGHAKNAWTTIDSSFVNESEEDYYEDSKGRLRYLDVDVPPVKDKHGHFNFPYFKDQDIYEVVRITDEILPKENEEKRYIFIQDNDSHWYMIEECDRRFFNECLEDEDYEDLIGGFEEYSLGGGIEGISFTDPLEG